MITDWNPQKAEAFGRETLTFTHDLAGRLMFEDAGLADLLDRYPRDKLGVFTMGEDPVAWTTWRRGAPGDLTGAQLLEAVQTGRIWLNLRAVNDDLPEYAALEREIFADKAAHAPALRRTFKRDLGMLISSADAQVFYHLDTPLVSLWQLRGEKRVWVYPARAPYASDEAIEGVVLRETAEQIPFDPAWDADAQVVALTPGRMVTWPQNGPHRIENGPMLNVSLSVEFMTPAALMRANVLYANGLLRRSLGAKPTVSAGLGPLALPKLAVARGAKALGLPKPNPRVLPPTFTLDPARPGVLVEG